jgi:cysteine desulfurase
MRERTTMIYFDHNATTPMLPQARQAWLEATEKLVGNPSSPHRIGSRADTAITGARQRLAEFLGCDALDLVWTSGATESNNTVLHHFARALPSDAEVWVSAIEHPCVMASTKHYFPERHRLTPVTREGVVDLNWLTEEMAHARPGLVAIMAANNETGVLQPWREALAICQQWDVPFFCDAAQWIGKLPASGFGTCTFVSGAAHKFGGPKGVGFLKCPAKGRVEPLMRGGPQEEGRRAGTENVAGILSMVAALEAREDLMRDTDQPTPSQEGSSSPTRAASSPPGRSQGWVSTCANRESCLAAMAIQRRLAWRDAFIERMLEALPEAEVAGLRQPRLWNTVSALMPNADRQQRWVVKLDKLGFAVSTGSACSSGKEEPSHVIAAMGYSPHESSRVLRFSSGWDTTEEDWQALLEALQKVHHGMSEHR